MNRNKKVELLVPAGGEKQFIAAVENGADAVYLGGRAFNARINAGNFDDEMMQKAVDYAHRRGVKVFVTMNTLLKDDELEEALRYAGFLYEAGVDALIIQDLGFGKLVGEHLPDFERHLSTQASCYDQRALEVAQKLGYKRVVPARELTLDEIRTLCEADFCDIEVFVHGALCICYSGQCQLSRYYGGRSGNRGQCAQPCRLPYSCDGVKSYPLSPKDNGLIDCLGELIDAGVYSFKIEGRMKSPEYVAVVTRIYRKYIDEYLRNGTYEVSDDDRKALLQIFNRGDFTKGYLYGESGDELMADFIPKNQGVLIGEVIKIQRDSTLIDISLYGENIEMGDGVEVHRKGSVEIPSGNVISYIKPLGGSRFRIGDLKGDIRVGDLLYRTSSKTQLEDARKSFESFSLNDIQEERKPIRKLPVSLELLCYGGTITLTAESSIKGVGSKDVETVESAVIIEGPYEYSLEHPTPRERYEAALLKTGSTPFEVVDIRLEGDFDISIRMSELNALRRRCLEDLEKRLCFRRERPEASLLPDRAEASEAEGVKNLMQKELFFYSVADYMAYYDLDGDNLAEGNISNDLRILLPLADMILQGFESVDGVIPYISNITKGREDEILESSIDKCVELCKRSGVYVGNLGWLERMNELGVTTYGDFGLNAYNKETKSVIRSLGASYVVDSLEAANEDTGAYPLMTSEHFFAGKRYIGVNGKQNLYKVDRQYSSQSLLVPAKDTETNNAFVVSRVYNLRMY